jgi:hypothetical protein
MNNLKIFNKKIVVLFIIIITILILFLGHRYSYILCSRLSCISLSSINTWKEQEIYENTSSIYRSLLTASGYSIRIEKNSNLSEKDATNLTLVNVMKIKGLFDNARSPYTGAISNEISCENKYKPEIKEMTVNGIKVTYYIGWLNNRLQYGVCLDDQLTHKAYNALFYCPNQKVLYHLEFIVAIKDNPEDSFFLNQIESIKCQSPLSKIDNIFP